MTSPGQSIEFGSPKKHELLDTISEILENAESEIQKEMMRASPEHNLQWLGAFKTQVTTVQGYLELAEEMGEITREEMDRAMTQLQTLTEKVEGLRSEYEPENKLIPVEIKKKLLGELNVLHLMAAAK